MAANGALPPPPSMLAAGATFPQSPGASSGDGDVHPDAQMQAAAARVAGASHVEQFSPHRQLTALYVTHATY